MSTSPGEEDASPPDNTLGLAHLRCLLSDLRNTKRNMREQLYKLLPFFNQVMESTAPSAVMEMFPDLPGFSRQASRVLVAEIRHRAADKSTEAASRAIAEFLQPEQSEETSRGWILLTAINMLASFGQPIVESMISVTLPSTLVKCLYVFFDLPPVSEDHCTTQQGHPPPTMLLHRRALLQNVFVQILVKLCSFVSAVEELAQRDDLQLLFRALTSWCPPHNVTWRKSAGKVLLCIWQHSLSTNVLRYIHEKECLYTCVWKMQHSTDLSPHELVEMIEILSCFLMNSSNDSQILLEDFYKCQGYSFLCKLMLRLEPAENDANKEALNHLVTLVKSMTTSGDSRPKLTCTSSLSPFLQPDFVVPQPSSTGYTVRNVQAFSVLQNAFLNTKCSYLASVVLDAIASIYMADHANYFILDAQHTLPQFCEKIIDLPEAMGKYFLLLEFVVFNLKYIPHKELITVSMQLKSSTSSQCNIMTMRTLLRFSQEKPVFSNIFREVGLLEVMVNMLHRYAALMKELHVKQGDLERHVGPDEQTQLACLVMETLTVLLREPTNSGLFREVGGARCVHSLVKYHQCRQPALMLTQQLLLSPNGEEDMGTLLGLMYYGSPNQLDLKTQILKTLQPVLRESHRSRTVFHKAGGFLHVTSLLSTMELSLSSPPSADWEKTNQQQVLGLLQVLFSTLTVAMRYEPSSCHYFITEIQYEKLVDAVRLLGCFSESKKLAPASATFSDTWLLQEEALFVGYMCPTLICCRELLGYLYKMAIDSFERETCAADSPVFLEKSATDPQLPRQSPAQDSSVPMVIHPGATLAMIDLLPAVRSESQPTRSLAVQLSVANALQLLVRLERNQQVLCEAGFLEHLFLRCSSALRDKEHPLHPPLQMVFESLASQALESKILRAYLRLGNPLNCGAWDRKLLNHYKVQKPDFLNNDEERNNGLTHSVEEFDFENDFTESLLHRKYSIIQSMDISSEKYAVPLERVKCLLSITPPRNPLQRPSVTPPFVEFDTSLEGFGCLFLPSLAPCNISSLSKSTPADSAEMASGIGSGERLFPPPSGLSYSTWFCVQRWSHPPHEHPVRLLTLVRRTVESLQQHICLIIWLCEKDHSLIISTKEEPLQNDGGFSENSFSYLTCCVRFSCGTLIHEGQWHHLVVVMSKGMLKNSTVALYIDGQHVNTLKLHYIHSTPGGSGSTYLPTTSTVYGYIGTPPAQRQVSSLVWRLGPTHFVEEALPFTSVTAIWELGPAYMGNFQAVPCRDSETKVTSPLTVTMVPEERVSFALYVLSASALSMAKIRRVYSKLDCKAITKQLSLSSYGNSTPVHLIHNAAGHLNGPARTLGAAVIGNQGVRVFVPKPMATTFQFIGGAACILGLVAMASDVEGLHVAVKTLVDVIKGNSLASKEMERVKGYQVLALLLKKKAGLLTSKILNLTFSLVGTIDRSSKPSIIPNSSAFKDLLCDFEIWLHAPQEVHLSLFEHFGDLLTEPSVAFQNIKRLQEFHLIPKLLLTLKDPSLPLHTIAAISNILNMLLEGFPSTSDLLRFGQFLSSTLPAFAHSERSVEIKAPQKNTQERGNQNLGNFPSCKYILLRNSLLDILLKLLFTWHEDVNLVLCERLVHTLGFDWLLMFMDQHLHPSTVAGAVQLLVVLLSNQPILVQFREGLGAGSWLDQTNPVLTSRISSLLGFTVSHSAAEGITLLETSREDFRFSGFSLLHNFMPKHSNVPELYLLMIALFLQQPLSELPRNLQCNFDLDSIWIFMFGKPSYSGSLEGSTHSLCTEAGLILMAMLRDLLSLSWQTSAEGSWIRKCPTTVMQLFGYLYHNEPDLASMWTSPEFLCALAASVFPINDRPYSKRVDEVKDPLCEILNTFPSSASINTSKSDYCNSNLTNHPGKKQIFDFMRVLIMDNLCIIPASKHTLIVDLLLEAFPEGCTQNQQKEFQSTILISVMEHLLAANVLSGNDAILCGDNRGSYQTLVNNVLYFTHRVVEKKYLGMLTEGSSQVLVFILKLIGQIKKPHSFSLSGIYQCLNRTILYMLSQSYKNSTQHRALLDTLQILSENYHIILAPSNQDQEFMGCLVHCLFKLYAESADVFGLKEELCKDIHDITIPSKAPADKLGRQLNRLWTTFILNRPKALENIFKVSLFTNKHDPVDLATAQHLIGSVAAKMWNNYIVFEMKHLSRREAVHPTTLSRLSRISPGISLYRLNSVQRSHKNSVSPEEISQWMFAHIAVIQDLVRVEYREFKEMQKRNQEFALAQWVAMESELLRERGLWGPPIGSSLDKFMLEMTEGPSRMRKKMVRNEMFYIHYPYVPGHNSVADSQKQPSIHRAISYDSKEYCMRLLPRSLHTHQQRVEQNSEKEFIQPQHWEDNFNRVKADEMNEKKQKELQSKPLESGFVAEENNCRAALFHLLNEGEKIQHMYRCARIQGLDTSEGLLLFGKEHFYVIDGFTITATREIGDIETLPADMYEPIIPSGARHGQTQLKRSCSIFAYEDIREVHKRRYLLQPIAVEVFSGDGRNYLLAFQKGLQNKIYHRFLAVVPSLVDSSESVSGQRPSTNVEQGASLLGTLVREKTVTQRWQRGEISNFQYLMHLNTLAGRSYNDLMQYPVFPWILADYQSEELDLDNPKTFRDLAKPMGAQTGNRLIQFKKRFNDWEDPHGETPAYHYGTHYSSAMIVASYLVRMEPFTQIFLRLQGGHFDLADRMFHSIQEAWLSASKTNMADVKELIPEFFYLPEFLLNSNNFDLGSKQNGTQLHDVILPPWAKGDPREFIRVHREALECSFVSAHLHKWIDLIFGFKQQGTPAVEAVNVYHHLFYEGQVDIYNINDPLKETATIGFINNFGQIPTQLFKKPHPAKQVVLRSAREPLSLPASQRVFFYCLNHLQPSAAPVKELKEPVGQIICTDKGILAVGQNKVLLPPTWGRTFAWGYADLSCRLASYESDKTLAVYECLSEWGLILCAICPSPKLVITGGTSTVVCVWQIGTSRERSKMLKLREILTGHTDAVTCLTFSTVYHIVVSGSRDCTCIIWDLSQLCFVTQLRGHHAPVSALFISDVTGDIVSTAGTYIYVWSVNGSPVVSVNSFTGRSQQILCCCMSELNEWDTQNVIVTGHSDGVVRFWRMEFLQIPERYTHPSVVPSNSCTETTPDDKRDVKRANQDHILTDMYSQLEGTSHTTKSNTSCEGIDSIQHWSDWLSMEEKEGFVFVNYSGGPASHPPQQNSIESVRGTYKKLKPGFKWEHQLVFQSKLTTHTAFDCKDNLHPAEISSLAITKDHSRILVGDTLGRIFSWSAGGHWRKDEVQDICSICLHRFSLAERRHRCRKCGQLICNRCSHFHPELNLLKVSSPMRVCQICYQGLQCEGVSEEAPS